MSNNLYPDFKLTEENCGDEPIHRPLMINGHGALMAWDIKNPYHPVYVSKNLAEILGVEITDFWQKDAFEYFKNKDLFTIHQKMHQFELAGSTDVTISNGKEWTIIHHHNHDIYFMEFEPTLSSFQTGQSYFQKIRAVVDPLVLNTDFEELFEMFARNFKEVSGYDRVMIYQFDDDQNGCVVGEAKNNELESFLGLHYPATDIPQIARELFLKNKSRIIPDVEGGFAKLIFNPNASISTHSLDLTYSQLRATSPIHIQYLKNMGVGATLTLALVVNSKLWGLIACHHYSPFFMSFEMRKTSEIIADKLCMRIAEIEFRKAKEKQESYRKKEQSLNEKIKSSWDIVLQLVNKQIDLRKYLDSDGCAVATSSLGIYRNGSTPKKEVISYIFDWANKNINDFEKKIYACRDIRSIVPDSLKIDYKVGGVILAVIPEMDDTVIMWFKKPEPLEVTWAGNPQKPYEIDYLENGSITLSPRKSFEKWKSNANYKSVAWDEPSLEMAHRIRELLVKKNNEWSPFTSKDYQNELDQITYVASHDLQEPLRTVNNYLFMISEALEPVEHQELLQFIERAQNATGRMTSLIKQMLNYSRVGHSDKVELIDTGLIVEEILNDLAHKIHETNAKITFFSLPKIYGDRPALKQLFQNLISNGLKYRKPNSDPRIKISGKLAETDWIFSVKDNGIGIEKKNFEKVFSLFQRLHHHSEIEGTGVGLAICRKTVEGMGGKIWLDSKPDKGTTVYFSIKNQPVKKDL